MYLLAMEWFGGRFKFDHYFAEQFWSQVADRNGWKIEEMLLQIPIDPKLVD